MAAEEAEKKFEPVRKKKKFLVSMKLMAPSFLSNSLNQDSNFAASADWTWNGLLKTAFIRLSELQPA